MKTNHLKKATENTSPVKKLVSAEDLEPIEELNLDEDPELVEESEPKDILVVMYVNDNHLSNVKTLQSIFSQKNENIYLLACNDATTNFQAERLLYNFLANKPDNIQQIYLVENHFPKGDVASLREKIGFVQADYALILHSGEYLADPDTLEQCVDAFNLHSDCQALAFSADLRSADMKKTDAIFEMPQNGPINAQQMRDCMLFYRYDALVQALQKNTLGASTIWKHALPHLQQVKAVDLVNCNFSRASIENTPCEIPETLGNQRMLKLAQKLAQNNMSKNEQSQEEAPSTRPVVPSKPTKKQMFIAWLTNQSRRKNILLYGILALLLIICAALFLLAVPGIGKKLGVAFAIVAAAAVLWCGALVAINLYHKKHQKG